MRVAHRCGSLAPAPLAGRYSLPSMSAPMSTRGFPVPGGRTRATRRPVSESHIRGGRYARLGSNRGEAWCNPELDLDPDHPGNAKFPADGVAPAALVAP